MKAADSSETSVNLYQTAGVTFHKTVHQNDPVRTSSFFHTLICIYDTQSLEL